MSPLRLRSSLLETNSARQVSLHRYLLKKKFYEQSSGHIIKGEISGHHESPDWYRVMGKVERQEKWN